MKAIIYKSTGSWYTARDESGKTWNARIKGLLKIDEITSTNPIAVGDLVELEPESADSAMVSRIYDRRNYINRQSPRHLHQHHIVAANIDQALMVATLKEPRTSQGFIDRFLVASEMYHVVPLILFNKSDLYRKKEEEKYGEWKSMYEEIGYRVLISSVKDGKGIEEVRAIMHDRTTLISGHSGVGKSSLLNRIFPDMSLRTKDVSGWSGKGQHTTSFAEMFDLPGGGKVIDTPGMREFGLVDLSRQELSHYFPEMRDRLRNCQFNNCTHENEPGCAIKEAVEKNEINAERYISYLKILDSIGKEF